MGKLTGFIKLEGTLDGLTFYKSPDGYLVRTKGGVSKGRIMNDPAFVRTRENLNEFGLNAQSGKVLRQSIDTMLHRAKDPKLSSRMLKMMHDLKNLDSTSVRGQRLVRLGVATAAGKQLLKGFDFNIRARLQSVLHAPYTLDPATGVITLADFITQEQLTVPEGATHVGLRSAFIDLDFETGIFDACYSPTINLVIGPSLSTVVLTPEAVPTGTGTQLYLLLIEFFQVVNGVPYALHNGAFNTLNLVEVV